MRKNLNFYLYLFSVIVFFVGQLFLSEFKYFAVIPIILSLMLSIFASEIQGSIIFQVLPYFISLLFYLVVFMPLYFLNKNVKYYFSMQVILLLFLFILGKFLLPHFVA